MSGILSRVLNSWKALGWLAKVGIAGLAIAIMGMCSMSNARQKADQERSALSQHLAAAGPDAKSAAPVAPTLVSGDDARLYLATELEGMTLQQLGFLGSQPNSPREARARLTTDDGVVTATLLVFRDGQSAKESVGERAQPARVRTREAFITEVPDGEGWRVVWEHAPVRLSVLLKSPSAPAANVRAGAIRAAERVDELADKVAALSPEQRGARAITSTAYKN